MQKKIVPILESIPHSRYVEPFGGGGSVLLGKAPVSLEVYNDVDSGLVDFFRVICDPELFERFYRRVELAPYSRELYDEARATWRDEVDLISRVAKWFIVARQSFGGRFGSGFGTVVTSSGGGMAGTCSAWQGCIEGLPEVSARLRRVQIENRDWRVILDRYDTDETLFYLDPPYVSSTRKSGEYAHEMSDGDHQELVERLLGIKGHAVLSGYASSLYEPLECAGWERVDFETVCYAAARTRATGILGKGAATEKQSRVESLWVSPRESSQVEMF